GAVGASLELRVDHQRAGYGQAEGLAAQLRRLPYAAARSALALRRRYLHEGGAAAHAELRQPEHPAASATAQSRAPDGGARRSARSGLARERRGSQRHQPPGVPEVGLRAEDRSAADCTRTAL